MVKCCKAIVIGMWLALAAFHVSAEDAISETEMALGYYLPLAEQGEPYAQLTIGEIYMEGAGVEPDLISAYAWFYVALFQGVSEAQPIMEHVYEKLQPEQQQQAQALAEQFIKAHTAPH